MRRRSRSRTWIALTLGSGIGLWGCGGSDDGLPRHAVSGTVTLDSQPLESGLISFLPTSPSQPTEAGSVITRGKYSIPWEKGLVPGTYKVAIFAASSQTITRKNKGRDAASVQGPPTMKEAIPPIYNTHTTLTADVKDGADNIFPFDLKTGRIQGR